MLATPPQRFGIYRYYSALAVSYTLSFVPHELHVCLSISDTYYIRKLRSSLFLLSEQGNSLYALRIYPTLLM